MLLRPALPLAALLLCLQGTAQSDSPCGAPLLTVNAFACNFIVASTAGAIYSTSPGDGGVPPCAFPGSPDAWFAVVVPPDGALAITTEEGSITDGGMALYGGPCTAPVFVECDDDDAVGMMPVIDRSDLVPGDTMYVRIWRGAAPGTGTMSVCAVVSHSDLRAALPVCESKHFNGTPYGPGSVLDENAQYCDISEYQSQWIRLHFTSSGTFTFLIRPDTVNGGVYPDYDWLLFNAGDTSFCTTHTPSTSPAACNGSSSYGPLGETGLDVSGTSNAVPAGPGNPYCPVLNVVADDLYYLFVNNYTTSSTGFDFVLGGTATLDCGLPISTGTGQLLSPSRIRISPSPTRGDVWLEGTEGSTEVVAMDAAGRPVLRVRSPGGDRMHLDLQHLAPGVYGIHVLAHGAHIGLGRVVVQR